MLFPQEESEQTVDEPTIEATEDREAAVKRIASSPGVVDAKRPRIASRDADKLSQEVCRRSESVEKIDLALIGDEVKREMKLSFLHQVTVAAALACSR